MLSIFAHAAGQRVHEELDSAYTDPARHPGRPLRRHLLRPERKHPQRLFCAGCGMGTVKHDRRGPARADPGNAGADAGTRGCRGGTACPGSQRYGPRGVVRERDATGPGADAAGDDDDSRWKMAHDVARQVAHSGGDPSVRADEADSVRSLLSVADLWLDAATELPPSGGQHLALSRAEWVERTLPTWRQVAEPVGASVAEALTKLTDPDQLAEQGMALPP